MVGGVRRAATGRGGGSAELDQFIIPNPVPGWAPVPPDQLSALVDSIQSEESVLLQQQGLTAETAGEGWQSTASPDQVVFILLMRISGVGTTDGALTSLVVDAAKGAAATFCSSATGAPPTSEVTVASIPNSHKVVCVKAPNGDVPVSVVFPRANILVETLSTSADSLGSGGLDSVALEQYKVLPAVVTLGSGAPQSTAPAPSSAAPPSSSSSGGTSML
jgi:hypothetical protein